MSNGASKFVLHMNLVNTRNTDLLITEFADAGDIHIKTNGSKPGLEGCYSWFNDNYGSGAMNIPVCSTKMTIKKLYKKAL